ncbi:hypothetical protein N7456_012293 [Penicillium angulare]|uniref:Aspartate/glutamate/uridylate kinase domain-containing protein n=1 Tax=Penicillium angulare TaxID=116970 RepID=A0A9W9EVA2_9EURO|nr:hypothetical protein N7456_012293 [Penicillium angulare]
MGAPETQSYERLQSSEIGEQPLSFDTIEPMHSSWVVQKFGGTSLGSFAPKIVEDIVIELDLLLLKIEWWSFVPRPVDLQRRMELQIGKIFPRWIEADHILAAQREVDCPSLQESLIESIQHECRVVMSILGAARLLSEMSPACVGRVVSAGEKLSCHHMVALLRQQGHKAEVVDASNLGISLRDQDFHNGLRDTVAKKLAYKVNHVDGIPVLTGYFGFSATSTALELVGRGYTDLCASLVASGLSAINLQIWKEVDGVFSADPRHIPDARLLHSLSIAELRDLTFLGSEVVHSTAVDVAESQNLTIYVRNVVSPKAQGTLITPKPPNPKARLTAITTRSSIAVLTFHCRPRDSTCAIYSYISEALQRWELSADIMSTNKTSISLAVSLPDDFSHSRTESFELRIRLVIEDLTPHFVGIALATKAAIISVVCRPAGIRDCVMATMLRTLNQKTMRVYMTMNGVSDISAGCVIEEKHVREAAEAIHYELFQVPGIVTPPSGMD